MRHQIYSWVWAEGNLMGAFLLISCAAIAFWALWKSKEG